MARLRVMGAHTAGPMLSLHSCHLSHSLPGSIVPALEWLRRGGWPTSTGETPILPRTPQAPLHLLSDGLKGRAECTMYHSQHYCRALTSSGSRFCYLLTLNAELEIEACVQDTCQCELNK